MSNILQVTKENAIKAHESAGTKGKKLLENLFGKTAFLKKITDRVKSYEDACEVLGITPLTLSNYDFLPESDRKSNFAHHKLTIIIRALNEGWVPNWKNSSEYKYYPYFDLSAGVGFSYSHAYFADSHSNVGSRLCLKTRELAVYVGETFVAEYKDLMII